MTEKPNGRTRMDLWGLYSPALTDEEIRYAFEFKHGYQPERIIRTGGGALAGPIVEDHHVVRES